ncbi:unnamed protein product [Miscanthus lutarioriparius]|uniref:MATH domain-containing protein n=1 Tax=Miscanthus lutarioriparius TaxID=422564 RepID=A0A811Q9M0_9POAL|nr:unnamed protein product [Miscanthus lutarioriparius]
MAASTVPEGRKTTSSCTPEIEQCSHVFEIHGYKLHEGLGVARALCSAASAIGGYEWTISYYSDGYWGQESSGYASVFVDFRSNKACPKGAKVRAFVRFGVVDPATGACEYITHGFHIKHTVLDPTIASHSWGFGKFIKKLHVVYPKALYGLIGERKTRHGHITIQDMEPGVFKALLHFIYTDSLSLLAANDDCDLDDEGVVNHLLVAADSSRNRIKDVIATKGYEHLKKACPSIAMNLLEEAVKSSVC